MAELVWRGKGRAPRRRAPPLHTDEVYGGEDEGAWRNRLVRGEAEGVLAAWRPELAGKVALAYVDPPFDTGGAFTYLASIPGVPDGTPRVALPAYEDARGLDAWLGWFRELATRLHEMLADGGSLYVHLDAHVAHYAKVLLDEVFGTDAFQREIIWRIGWVSGFKSRVRGWIRNHDTLLFYAKGGKPATFHKEYIPYSRGYVRRDGAKPKGPGYPLEDVWNASELDRMDSIQIVSFSGEKVGYPTQKNESLVARVVRASSNPGDLVLDCCAGSGTTPVVAEKLGRRWAACDVSPLAVHATRTRLLGMPEVKPFVVERVGGPSQGAGKLKVRVARDGPRCTLTLESFAMRDAGIPAEVRAAVKHWSQWLQGWAVDWQHDGGPLRAGTWAWRGRRGLELSATRVLERSAASLLLVKAFDVLGGETTHAVKLPRPE
ncbi:MAG: site-specific DNA-methyltransferase [Polyangiaceae bacterium]|jgi:hypothetical protein